MKKTGTIAWALLVFLHIINLVFWLIYKNQDYLNTATILMGILLATIIIGNQKDK